MAQGFVTGACHIYPGIGAGKSYVYLGTAEMTPRLEIRPEHVPYFNSILSTRVPLDWCDQGFANVFMADINRLNMPVAAGMFSRPNPGGVFGLQAAGDLGTLVIQEGFSYPLCIQFPYSAKPAMQTGSGGAMPAGYVFANARLVGPDSWEPLNMTPLKIRFVWELLPTTTVGANNMTVAQYHVSQMPTLPPAT